MNHKNNMSFNCHFMHPKNPDRALSKCGTCIHKESCQQSRLACIIDLFHRKIRSWRVGSHLFQFTTTAVAIRKFQFYSFSSRPLGLRTSTSSIVFSRSAKEGFALLILVAIFFLKRLVHVERNSCEKINFCIAETR